MKKNGKDICAYLKEVRRHVADENNIPLEQHECTYDGPCDGTCPRCEAEVKYLEHELHRRMTLGKAAAVAGVAMSLAAFTSCGEPETGDIYIPEDTTHIQNDTTNTNVDTTSGASHSHSKSNNTIQYQ